MVINRNSAGAIAWVSLLGYFVLCGLMLFAG